MKTFASTHSRTQNNVKDERGNAKHCFARVQASNNAHIREHSPIYDLQAYKARQRKIKRQNFLKNTAEASMYFCAAALTFSMLFWGV